MNTYEEIYHFGIKGQKWGVRRYQNADGSLTKAGIKRYQRKFNRTPEGKALTKKHKEIIKGIFNDLTFGGNLGLTPDQTRAYERNDEHRALEKDYKKQYSAYVRKALAERGNASVKDISLPYAFATSYGPQNIPENVTTREYMRKQKEKRMLQDIESMKKSYPGRVAKGLTVSLDENGYATYTSINDKTGKKESYKIRVGY